MDAIENAAYVSVGRACGFAGLAIFCLLAGLSFDPVLATQTGGKACLVVTGVLAFYAWRAPHRPYRRTELWLILDKAKRPPREIAQKVIGTVLKNTYVWFAQQAAAIAAILLLAAVAMQLAGVARFDLSHLKRADHGACQSGTATCLSNYLPAIRTMGPGFSMRNP